MTPGYWQRDDVTRATFRDGWLRTGDLGYLFDGQVVVCGRIKDVIIVGARNVFPEDIERAAAAVEGVRPGNVIAFGTNTRRGKEGIVVVAETRADADAPLRVRDEVVDRVCDVVGNPAVRGDPRAGRQPAQDVVGQAPALSLPFAVPRGLAAAGLKILGTFKDSWSP